MNIISNNSYWTNHVELFINSIGTKTFDMQGRFEKLKNACSINFTHKINNNLSLAYTMEDKQKAQDAIDELLKYKAKFGDFSPENVEVIPELELVMTRYKISCVEELNDWLGNF